MTSSSAFRDAFLFGLGFPLVFLSVLHVSHTSEQVSNSTGDTQLATLAGGCFWCIEAVFDMHKGVSSAVSGYMGGTKENPTYKEVCTGTTGHAEVVQITFDPKVVTYEELLKVFWKVHDPTQLNKQGNDVGTQYRSAIFYHDDEQKKVAESSKHATEEAKMYPDKLVTEITQAAKFYIAEDYHQDYFKHHPNQSYCKAVVAPKVHKFQELFKDKVKEDL